MVSMNKKIIAFSLVSLCLSSCDWIWPFGEDLDSSSPISYTEWHLQNTTGEQIILHRYYEKIRSQLRQILKLLQFGGSLILIIQGNNSLMSPHGQRAQNIVKISHVLSGLSKSCPRI